MLARRYEFNVLVARTISHSFVSLTREILFLPLEHKIHIFSPLCNILYISGLNIPFWRATRLNNRKKSNISIVSNIFTCKAYHSTCMKVLFENFCLNGSKRGIYPEKVNIFGSRLPPCETYIIFPAHCTVVHVINSITWKMLNRHEASIKLMFTL